MRIEAFLICWNEREILPFVIKHYQKFCDSITIYDNYSDDGSDILAEQMGCKVIKYDTNGQLNDDAYKYIKNTCWKDSTADYVIVCDADEVLFWHHLNFGLLPEKGKPSIWKTQGWQITSNEMPKEDILEITNGYKFDNYSKSIIFSPTRIKEMNFNYGAHRTEPVGDVVYSEETLYVLHYRQIGGVKRLINRYRAYKKRMSAFNKMKGHGSHYLQQEQKILNTWKQDFMKSKPLA